MKAAVAFSIIALAAATLLVGCGNSSSPGEVRSRHNRLNYANIDEPKRLDPAFIKDLYEGIVSGFIYDGLVVFGKGTDIEPGLASSWEISSDRRTYTFHLRPEARFSDGRIVTAADVRYSFTRVLRPETQSDRKWVLNRIDGADEVTSSITHVLRGIQTPTSHTVVITLREPYPVFLKMLAMPTAVIIPEGSAGAGAPDPSFDQHPIGSGPWKLDEWVHDQRLVFHQNEHFWGRKPSFGELIFHVQVDETARRQQFETGKHDIYQVGFMVYDSWMRDKRKESLTTAVQELRTDFFGFMNEKPTFRDKRVRQAISHGINTGAIFENLQKSRGELAHGPVPPGIAGYRSGIAPRSYDPERARSLLANAGVANLEIKMWYRDDALSGEMVQSARQDLAKIGVRVVPVARDLASLRTGVHNGEPDMYLGSWTLDYPDIENALAPPFHSRNIPRQGNGSHFSNSAVDELIQSAEHASDPDDRIRKFQAVEDKIIDECPWVFLFHRKVYYAVQPWLVGWKPAVMYNADRFNDVELK